MSPFSEEARRQMAELEARHRGKAWLRGDEAALLDSRFGARTVGTLAEVTLGMELWSRQSLEGRVDYTGEPRGGIVVGIDGGGRYVTDDGEVVEHPARFQCYDPFVPLDRAFVWLTEDQVDPETVGVPRPASIVIAIRRFAGELCEHRRQRDRPRHLSSWEADLARYAYLLSAVAMGERR